MSQRLTKVTLREAVQVEGCGWLHTIDTHCFKISLSLHDSGYVSIFKDGKCVLNLHPGLILTSVPYRIEDAEAEAKADSS